MKKLLVLLLTAVIYFSLGKMLHDSVMKCAAFIAHCDFTVSAGETYE